MLSPWNHSPSKGFPLSPLQAWFSGSTPKKGDGTILVDRYCRAEILRPVTDKSTLTGIEPGKTHYIYKSTAQLDSRLPKGIFRFLICFQGLHLGLESPEFLDCAFSGIEYSANLKAPFRKCLPVLRSACLQTIVGALITRFQRL
jgi:hypothetical protein